MGNIDLDFGQIVYLKTDTDQYERIVTGILLRYESTPTYYLGLGSSESWHQRIEISTEKDQIKKLNG